MQLLYVHRLKEVCHEILSTFFMIRNSSVVDPNRYIGHLMDPVPYHEYMIMHNLDPDHELCYQR